MSKSGRESPELPKTKRPRIGSPPAPAAITTLLDPISSRTRLAKRKTTVQRSPVWVEKVGKGKHQPASSAATQEEVGEWLGLFDMIEATDKGKQVLSDEEAELIACAVDHNAVVDDTHIFTPTQIIKQTRDRTTDEGCQCQLHSAIRTMSDTDEFHRLLQELLALMSENSGEVMSGNGANIAITLIKYILQKAGFYSVQVLMEGKSSIAAKRSTHARCTVGVGSGKEEKSIVIDSTPDFFGRSLHTARAVYIFAGEVKESSGHKATYPVGPEHFRCVLETRLITPGSCATGCCHPSC